MRLLKQVLYLNPVTGPSMAFFDLAGNLLFSGSEEEGEPWYDPALDTIVETVTTGFEEIAAALTGFGSDIGSGLLDLIRSAGVAVIEAVSDTYDYTANKVGDKKVQLVSSLTVLIIAGFTASYILARLPSSNSE